MGLASPTAVVDSRGSAPQGLTRGVSVWNRNGCHVLESGIGWGLETEAQESGKRVLGKCWERDEYMIGILSARF